MASTRADEVWRGRPPGRLRPEWSGDEVLSALSSQRAFPWLSLLLTACAVTLLPDNGFSQQPVAGSRPGTERWLVCLRDRNYDLAAQLRQIRATVTSAQRATMVSGLNQLAMTDQAAVNTVVASAGGVVVRNFWVSSALSVEIAPSLLPALRLLPRVRALVPIEARSFGDAVATAVGADGSGAVPLPITASTGPLNHNVQAAWTILGSKGAGAVVAFFDTGIDAEAVLSPRGAR